MAQGRRAALALGLTGLVCVGAGAAPPVAPSPPEPTGYRMGDYRAPVPSTLRGARVLTTAEAEALWRNRQAAFIDVLPRAPRPKGLAPGTIWHREPYRDIPGSTWLPDTGYGALAPATLAYFERGLAEATGGDRNRIVVIYCKPDCWMSWNAAKRALSLGYHHVCWYPGGAEAWRAAGLSLAEVQPLERAQ